MTGKETTKKEPYKRPGHTPLIHAILGGQEDKIDEFLAGGAVEKAGRQKLTPMHACAIMGNLDTARKLKERGCSLNVKDDVDNTPLHWASGEGHTEFVEWLLLNGTKKDAVNQMGQTAYDVARTLKKPDCAAILRPIPNYWVLGMIVVFFGLTIAQLIRSQMQGEPGPLETQAITWLILFVQGSCLLSELKVQVDQPGKFGWGRGLVAIIGAFYVANLLFGPQG